MLNQSTDDHMYRQRLKTEEPSVNTDGSLKEKIARYTRRPPKQRTNKIMFHHTVILTKIMYFITLADVVVYSSTSSAR